MASIFYEPVLCILKDAAPDSLSISAIIAELESRYPNLEWCHTPGPVAAMLDSIISKHGDASPFIRDPSKKIKSYKVSNAVSSNPSSAIVDAVTDREILFKAYSKMREETINHILEKMSQMEPRPAFEDFVNFVIGRILGRRVTRSKRNNSTSGDGGIDGIARDPLEMRNIMIQTKHYTEKVQRPELQSFKGAIGESDGIFVSLNGFSNGAIEFVNGNNKHSRGQIKLLTGRDLAKLMLEHHIGVSVSETYELFNLNTDFFTEYLGES